MKYTAHVDTFAHDNLPPQNLWPELIFELPELQYPERLNCAVELVDYWVEQGHSDHLALRDPQYTLTYRQLMEKVNQTARVLTEDMKLIPGSRVLLRGANNAMMGICWLAVVKAGLIAVTTMPLLRSKELKEIIAKAQVSAAICDKRLDAELVSAQSEIPILAQIIYFNDPSAEGLEIRMESKPTTFDAVDTSAEDVVLIAFTSGTTGKPKGTMHFHRDVLAISDCFPKSIVKMTPDDVCLGTPPLAFTFGLGGVLTFPLRVGASTVLIEKMSPEQMLQAIDNYGVTITWTSPFFYRQMSSFTKNYSLKTLRASVSAGEALPISTRTMWREVSGIEMIDGIGATEILHIFISAAGEDVRPGATGKPIPGYQATVLDIYGNPLPAGQIGRLAVKGPTGCRYLADDRQRDYVQNGWNITGDAYLIDEDGYFFYQARNDDMIITAGYNVAGPEVEDALLKHPAIAECAVIGVPDEERGQIIKAFVVLKEGHQAEASLVKTLQDFVKESIAPYKYPRAIEFCESLPRTETGKLQRYKLRQLAAERAN